MAGIKFVFTPAWINIWKINKVAKPQSEIFKKTSSWLKQFLIILKEIYKNIEAINGHKIEIYVRGEGATPMTLDHIDLHTREFYRHEKEIDKSLKEIDINIGIIHGQVKDIYKDISRELDLL